MLLLECVQHRHVGRRPEGATRSKLPPRPPGSLPSTKASKASPKVAKRAGHLHMLGSQRTLLNAQRAIVELDCLTASFPRRCSAQQVASRKSEPSASRASCRRPSQHGPTSPVPYAAERLPREKLLRVIDNIETLFCTFLQQPHVYLHVYCALLRVATQSWPPRYEAESHFLPSDFCEQITASRFLSAEDETVFHLHVRSLQYMYRGWLCAPYLRCPVHPRHL
jgi:hypothetical protein